MIPPNLAGHPALIFSAKDWGLPTLGSDLSYQLLVPNGLSLPASLVALRQDFLRSGGAEGRNRQPPHPPEGERICTVHVNRAYGVAPVAHDKHFNYLDIVLTTNGGGAYNAEQPRSTGDVDAEAYDVGEIRQRRNMPLVEAGRSDDSCGVLDIWGSKGDCQSICSDSLESSRAEPIMTSRNVRSGKKTYMITFADQYICSPLWLALRYRDNGGSIYHDSANDGLLPRGNSKFADRAVGPAGNEMNWRESTQFRTYFRVSGRHPGCLRKLMGVLPLLRRKLPRNPGAAKIQAFWLECDSFFNQHSLNRRAINWGNSLFGRGGIYRYINCRSAACEWLPNHYKLAEVPVGGNSPRRSYWTAYSRTAGVPTRGPSGWFRRPSAECRELPPICERFASTIRDLKNVSYPSSDATGALVAHSLEMNRGTLGAHGQYQLWQDEPTTVFPSSYGAAPRRFADTFGNELNEPNDTRHTGEPPCVNASATLGLYELPFGTAKRGVENGFTKTGSCSVGTLQSSQSPRMGRRIKGPSPRNHRVESPNNHNVACGHPCSTLLAYILCAPARAPLNSDGGNTDETPTIQSHIYKSLSHEHSRGSDGPSMPAHGSSYQFFGSPAQNTGLAHGGMSGTGSTAADSYGVATFPKVNRRGKLELARGGWPHIRARIINDTLGRRINDLPREGGSSLLSPMLGQPRAGSGASGIHDETVYRLYRIEESLGSGGNSAAGKESPGGSRTTNYLSFHPPRISRPFEGVERFTKPWQDSAFGIYELLRARAPRFLTQKRRYSSEATPGSLSDISPQRSKFHRTDTRRWVGFPFSQPSYESAFGRLLGNDSNSEYLAMGALLLILSVLIGEGLAYIDLWARFGVAWYWLYPLQKYGFGGSMHQGSRKHRGGEQQKSFTSLVADLVANIEHCMSIGGYYLLLHGGITSGWLYNDAGFDIYTPLKLLQIQFIVTDENNTRHELGGIYDHASSNNYYGYRAPQWHGPHYYLRCLAKGYNRDMPKHMLHHSDSGTEVSSALWQRMTPLDETSGVPSATPQSGFSPSKGILLIGSSGMGRSYLMKDLAADSEAPLVPISSSSLYETECYITINDGKTNEMELPATSSCRLIIFGGLVERISPRVVWIQDTHKFGSLSPEDSTGEDDAARVGTARKNKEMNEEEERGEEEEEKKEEEVEGKKSKEIKPPTFPLLALLIFLTGPANHAKSMLVIGSTHAPGEMDPSFICSNRLDRLINARALSTPRRQNQFPIILCSRRFNLADDNNFLPCRNAPRYKALCSYARDLGSLANEALLVKTYQSSIHYGNAIGSVLLGQAIHDYNICSNDVAPYFDHTSRVGKAVTRGTVVGSPSVGSLYAGILKDPTSDRQFSRMSKCYESSIVETTFEESTVTSLALGCLAGSAVHSWVAPENRRYDFILLAGSTIFNSVPARADLAESIAAECQWSDESQFPYDDPRFAYLARAAAEGPMWEASVSAPSHPLMIGEDKCRRTKYTTVRTWTKGSASGKPYSWTDTAVFTPAGRTPTDFSCTSETKDPNDLDYDLALLFRRLSASFTRRHPGATPQVSKYRQQMEKVPFIDRFPVSRVGRGGAKYRSPEPASFTGKRFIWEPSSPSADCKIVLSHTELHMDIDMDKAGPLLRGAGADSAGDGGMNGGDTNEQLTGTPIEYSNLATSDEAPDKSIAKRPYSWSGRLALRGRRSITEKLGAWPQFNRSPLVYPSFLDEGWLICRLPHTGARSESPSQRQIWSGAGPLPDNAPTRRIISESHKYLMKGLSANVVLLSKVIGIFMDR